jgi:hypothetical protein
MGWGPPDSGMSHRSSPESCARLAAAANSLWQGCSGLTFLQASRRAAAYATWMHVPAADMHASWAAFAGSLAGQLLQETNMLMHCTARSADVAGTQLWQNEQDAASEQACTAALLSVVSQRTCSPPCPCFARMHSLPASCSSKKASFCLQVRPA